MSSLNNTPPTSNIFQIALIELAGSLLVGLIVGYAIWKLGQYGIKRRTKSSAIRDLMTYRGDYSSPAFRRSLNKISITFHDDEKARTQIRELYELINNPSSQAERVKRKIVGVIYYLCQNNDFGGITEYDIDQSFPEEQQVPSPSNDTDSSAQPTQTVVDTKKKKTKNKKTKAN